MYLYKYVVLVNVNLRYSVLSRLSRHQRITRLFHRCIHLNGMQETIGFFRHDFLNKVRPPSYKLVYKPHSALSYVPHLAWEPSLLGISTSSAIEHVCGVGLKAWNTFQRLDGNHREKYNSSSPARIPKDVGPVFCISIIKQLFHRLSCELPDLSRWKITRNTCKYRYTSQTSWSPFQSVYNFLLLGEHHQVHNKICKYQTSASQLCSNPTSNAAQFRLDLQIGRVVERWSNGGLGTSTSLLVKNRITHRIWWVTKLPTVKSTIFEGHPPFFSNDHVLHPKPRNTPEIKVRKAADRSARAPSFRVSRTCRRPVWSNGSQPQRQSICAVVKRWHRVCGP